MISLKLIKEVRRRFVLNWHGIHGVQHWARVYENGIRLAMENGANLRVVQLFALFHDSCRLTEGHDPDHGPRGASLARSLHGRMFHLGSGELVLLEKACTYHTAKDTHDDITVRTCFDADRLDLGRVGIMPDQKLLCTETARQPETIKWATEQSQSGILPDNILSNSLL